MTALLVLPGALGILAVANFLSVFCVAAAILLTVTGMALHWRMPGHRMSVEERMKDGDLSEDEARRRIRSYDLCAKVATMLGVIVIVMAVMELG
jgi:hypothetical protein